MNFREMITPAAVAAYWNEFAQDRVSYLGRGLFPARKKASLDLSWLKGAKGLPISLMPSAFDAKATFRDRVGVSKITTEMPFFREGYKIKERDRQELLRAAEGNDPYAQEVLGRIFDGTSDLIAAADVVPERMIMQLLFPVDGQAGITITANGVNYTYNYDPDGSWAENNYIALTGNDLWTAPATANPFAAIREAQKAVRAKTGGEVALAIMNSTTFNYMVEMDAVKNRVAMVNGGGAGWLTDGEVINIFRTTTGLDIAVYDKMYRDEDGVTHTFVPDGYVALVPNGELGSTWYGTTPEEADLMGEPEAEVAIVNTGVALTRVVEEHPVNVNLFASEIVLPSFERMDEVAVLKVIA